MGEDNRFDVLIVGGGIAGASLGAELAGASRVLLVEAEDQCGYHSTGRSAAFWLESYGGEAVRPLTVASRDFLQSPPPGFAPRGFLSPRGAVHIARQPTCDALDNEGEGPIERQALVSLVPGLRTGWDHGWVEPNCSDIDVGALHAAYLAALRRSGGSVRSGIALRSAHFAAGCWSVILSDGSRLDARVIVDAAGAWADDVAGRCGVPVIGIAPKRRTMVQLRVGRSGLRALPLVSDCGGTFYFKGEGDRSVWLSPHDEIDSDPCDCAPEELDVALAIDRFQAVVDWPVEAVERRWAGLRSFSPDRVPVYGFDPDADNFFWFAGQGGFGIQTAPAAARLAAALISGKEPQEMVAHIAVDRYSPRRFRDAQGEGQGDILCR